MPQASGIYPGLQQYGNTGGYGMPSLPGSMPGLPGLPGLPGSSFSVPSSMPPPLPGMMPGFNVPQMPQSYPQPPTGPSPSVPSKPSNPPAVEPTAQGIAETPCQAVHVPPEENFFTVSRTHHQGRLLLSQTTSPPSRI